MRIKRVAPSYYEEGYEFKCPGCRMTHIMPVRVSAEQVVRNGGNRVPEWTFNGSLERPTFQPSLLVTWNYWREEHGFDERNVCHSFIRDGQIQFLSDCTHALAGHTVDLAEIAQPTPPESAGGDGGGG